MKSPLQRIAEIETEVCKLAKLAADLDCSIRSGQCCTAHRAIAQQQLVAIDERMEQLQSEMELMDAVYHNYIRRSVPDDRYRKIEVGAPVQFFGIESITHEASYA